MKRFLILLLFATSVFAEPPAPPFIKSITPSSGPASGGTTVVITGDNFGPPPGFACVVPCPTRVRFDGRDAQLLDSSNTSLVVKAPPHDAGPVDVTVVSPDQRIATATAAFLYTDVQESAYQKILLPIYLESPVNGSNGSTWQTDLWLHNAGDTNVSIVTPCPMGALCIPTTPLTIALQPDVTVRNLTPTVQVNPGRILYVSRESAANLTLNLRLNEQSRNETDAGVEIPVIREDRFLTGITNVHNIPYGQGVRVMLRIYELALDSADFRVRTWLEFPGPGPRRLISETTLTATSPENGPFRLHPAYTELSSFPPPVPAPAGVPLRMDVQPLTPGSHFWAFVSITNNATEHVTLITPQ